MTTVLVASDKFKGSLTAAQVADAVGAGIRRVSDATVVTVPVADGGDGTVDAAVSAGFDRVAVTASGPTGDPVETAYARRGDTAVVEMADVSGLVRLPGGVRQPLTATSRGLGEVIAAAVDAGCTQVVVGIGGSAGTDGGAGLVTALGARLLDAEGEDLPGGGAALERLVRIDLGALRSRLEGVSVTVASDVDNPLLGERGAAAVYGPQKGATPQDVERLDAALAHWADVVEEVTGREDRHLPGAGAAGGVGFGLVALLGARVRSGIDLLLELVGFDAAVAQLRPGDLVVTGEGSLDEQTLHGKAPAGVAQAAAARGIPVVAVCGRTTLDPERLSAAGIEAVYALTDIEPDPQRCFAEAGPLLERVAERLARDRLSRLTRGAEDGVVDMQPSEPVDLLVRAGRVMLPGGESAADIGVRDGKVVAVEPPGSELVAGAVLELGDDEILLPGIVDSHVHVNDPGRTEWEGFTSATRAAAAGGVTTIVDMPLNSIPPTVDVSALEVKRKTADGQCWVDVGFWGGAVPGNLADLVPMHEAGVFGFKCFLIHSGVDEFPHLPPDQVEAAMREIAAFDGLLIVHAEDPDEIEHAPDAHGPAYQGFLDSRPRDAENRAIEHIIAMSRETGCRVHILHVSSSDALPMIAAAEVDGVRISAETCPHYLTFTSEEIPEGGTQYKCCPPIREASNRDRLWEGLRDGTIDIVVSDHSPSTPDLKLLDTGDFGGAWGGISSLQLGLSAVWTEARTRGFTLADVVRWMSSGPADFVGLPHKGRIAVGADADFCVFAPDGRSVVDVTRLHHKNAITPYAGRTLDGVVRSTWLRGIRIDVAAPPRGRQLTRGES